MEKKLFQLPAEIIEGYNLTTESYPDRKSRKVFLLGRPLNSGNVSLFFYSCDNNQRQRRTTGKFLVPEFSIKDKTRNSEIYAEALAECNALNEEIARNGAIYKPKKKARFLFVIILLNSVSKP